MNSGNRGQTLTDLVVQLTSDELIQRKKRRQDSRSNPNFERWFYEAGISSRPVDDREEVEPFNIKVRLKNSIHNNIS